MIKKTSEIVTTFREGETVIGILIQNGKTDFYRVTHATKDFVGQLLEVDVPEEDKKKLK